MKNINAVHGPDEENYRYMPPELVRAREICRRYNSSPYDPVLRKAVLEELFDKKLGKVYIEPPFFCDYGTNITLGNNFYANFNTVILDCAPVTVGDDVMLGPCVQIYAVGHPTDPVSRRRGVEETVLKPVSVGNNVWIGGNSTILPGVSIGDDSVVGAGSVVTKDVPAGVLAAGNPCVVIRKL